MHFKVVKRYGQTGWALKTWEGGKLSYLAASKWPAGLTKAMTLEVAREYVKRLNSSTRITSEEGKKIRAMERFQERSGRTSALLPPAAVLEYEKNNLLFLPAGDPTRQKRESYWNAAQKMVLDLGTHPTDWPVAQEPFYLYAKQKRWSWDFFQRVVSALNRYGRIYCRMERAFFADIKLKDQRRKIEIETAFGDGQESQPLALKTLQDLKGKLPPAKFGWLWVGFWFGLRPQEINILKSGTFDGMKTWWTEEQDGVLVVYQPKLRGVKPKKRYKRVPIRLEEQRAALKFIQKGELTPLTKTDWRKHMPADVSPYGCRHGFAVHMDQLGVDVYAISRWLGHQSVTTTERYYIKLGLKRE